MYKGKPMRGNISAETFHTTGTKQLTTNTLTTLETRFADISMDIVTATCIANFKQWLVYTKQDDVKGKDIKILLFA